jgi:hypothetical protein
LTAASKGAAVGVDKTLRFPHRNNPHRIFAAHEIAAFADVSMATKMTVHFNLFGGKTPSQTFSTAHIMFETPSILLTELTEASFI